MMQEGKTCTRLAFRIICAPFQLKKSRSLHRFKQATITGFLEKICCSQAPSAAGKPRLISLSSGVVVAATVEQNKQLTSPTSKKPGTVWLHDGLRLTCARFLFFLSNPSPWDIRARKIRAHGRILRLEHEVLRPKNLVQSQRCA